MAWVSTGTVSVTNGSVAVTGSGTNWFGSLQNGWGFVGPDGRTYEILTVNSNTSITLKTAYQGATAGAQTYAAFPTGSQNFDLTAALQALIGNYQGVYDTVGQGRFNNGTEAAPGITFDADRDTGLRRAASNALALVAGGTDQLHLTGGVATGDAVQIDPLDLTAGKLLRLGALGLGVKADELAPSVLDMDTAPSGFGRIAGSTNGAVPSGVGSGAVLTLANQIGRASQLVFPSNTNQIYIRTKHNDEWLDWVPLITPDNASFDDVIYIQKTENAGYLQIESTGEFVFDFDVIPPDSTAKAGIRFFRDTNTTGDVTFDILQGNGGTNINHRLGGNVNSYMCNANGTLSVGGDASYDKLNVFSDEELSGALYLRNTHASFARRTISAWVNRAGSSDFDFLRCVSNAGASADLETVIRGDGFNTTDGTWAGGGADFAEFFEWLDGNPTGEDRRGTTVVLDGDKIRPALAGEDPFGAISANPTVIGDSDIERWKEKYLRDDFGSYIWEDYESVSWTEMADEPVSHSYAAD
ncbi:hypothetical protein TRIHO_13640 [Tritonibacter horizontis]|uniref:Peptidase G2 IMC autoproteolytic cleavage domain-containing protein n=1 Tax=Tritonibacter horizontis TaxID=1768241 RepID=A0A132C0L0_9RHOB|nr:hypothetical protein TRIHO_13640 [Tritonibacter horizontis]